MKHLGFAAAVAAILVATAHAQEYVWDRADEAGIEFRVHKRLKRLPLRLGDGDDYLVARYEPIDSGDFIHGKFGPAPWGLRVIQFKKAGETADAEKPEPKAKADEAGDEATGTASAGRTKDKVARNFNDWVRDAGKGPSQRYVVEAKPFKKNKGKGDKLAYDWWEYTNTTQMTNGYQQFEVLIYNFAAAYDLGDRIVTVICDVPVKDGKSQPEPKYKTIANTMLLSVSQLGATDDTDSTIGDAKRDQYADTPEKQKALEAAKANIADMMGKGWDYFTTPSYIVLYSWDATKADKRIKQYKASKELVDSLEEMRKLYQQLYPPHDKMGTPYSVVRILYDYSQFSSYGGTPGGVVGWFSPATKELVVFFADTLQPGLTDAVTYHEGWHQYCDSFFGTEMHRWFDEGTGDYFGSFELQGRGKWKYEPSKLRKDELRRMLNESSWVPFSEIVTWNKDKFYGNRATDYYAQGYAMIDFFRRGPDKLGRKWNPAWSKILDTYRDVALQTKKQKEACDAAFKDADWEGMEKLWVDWVKKEIL